MNCPSPFRFDEPDSYPWEEEWSVFGPLPPRPAFPDEHEHGTRIPNSILCILLSVAVHLSLIAMPRHSPSLPPMLVMELSLGIMGESGTGDTSDALPGGGAPASMPTRMEGKPAQPAAILAPQEPPFANNQRSEAPERTTSRKISPTKKARNISSPKKTQSLVPQSQPETSGSTSAARNEDPAPSSEGSPTRDADEAMPAGQGDAPVQGKPGSAGCKLAGKGRTGSGTGHGNGGMGDSGVLVFGSSEGPSFASQKRPKYPRLAVARREQGTVKLMIHLDEKGRLLDAKIIESAGSRLDQAALDAARASTYRPAVQGGNPLPCRAIVLMRFALRS